MEEFMYLKRVTIYNMVKVILVYRRKADVKECLAEEYQLHKL